MKNLKHIGWMAPAVAKRKLGGDRLVYLCGSSWARGSVKVYAEVPRRKK